MNDKRKVAQIDDNAITRTGASAHDESHSSARRRLFMALAAGAGFNLPARWTRPVVDAVLLPAHAQTTGCSELRLDGLINTCRDPQADSEYFSVDDTQDCPEVIAGDPDAPDEVVLLRLGRQAWTEGVAVYVSAAGSPYDIMALTCADPEPDDSIVRNMGFNTLSGAPWLITYTLSRTATPSLQVSISDIVLTPV